MDGILNLNKPVGPTSHTMVAIVKHVTGAKRVGHAGTLDPMASGVLPICLGQATRVVEYLMDTTKTYLAGIQLGVTTDTYDIQGVVTNRSDYSHVTKEQGLSALRSLTGNIQQVPPVYSALKYHGKPLYALVRAGVNVVTNSRLAYIEKIDLKDWHLPFITIEVTCGKGTYVRSLAHDLGKMLGCGATLVNLVRTRYGIFSYARSVTPEQFKEAYQNGYWENWLYPLDSILEKWPALVVGDELVKTIMNGQPVRCIKNSHPSEGAYSRVYRSDGSLLGIMRYDNKNEVWQPMKIFNSLTPLYLYDTNNSQACNRNCA